MAASAQENPFKIEEGIENIRVSRNSELYTHLSQTLAKLPIDKKKSTFIPVSVIATYTAAATAVRKVEKLLQETINAMKDCKFSLSQEKDENKQYKGSRVWRIN